MRARGWGRRCCCYRGNGEVRLGASCGVAWAAPAAAMLVAAGPTPLYLHSPCRCRMERSNVVDDCVHSVLRAVDGCGWVVEVSMNGFFSGRRSRVMRACGTASLNLPRRACQCGQRLREKSGLWCDHLAASLKHIHHSFVSLSRYSSTPKLTSSLHSPDPSTFTFPNRHSSLQARSR